MTSQTLRAWVITALCFALCMMLPLLTGQIPEIGSMLLPMHIPVFLCGFLVDYKYGAALGFIAPIARFAFFGMPILLPTGLAMAFELSAYGFLCGFLYNELPKQPVFVYVTLLASMLLGRIAWGLIYWALCGIAGNEFTFALFLSGAFIKAVPGIICHILIIPPTVLSLRKAKLARA